MSEPEFQIEHNGAMYVLATPKDRLISANALAHRIREIRGRLGTPVLWDEGYIAACDEILNMLKDDQNDK